MDQPKEQPETKTLYPSVCDVCMEKNLAEKIDIITCIRCGELTCLHLCSTVDPAYCHECMRDVQMTDQTITKTSEHYNEEEDKVYVKKQSARQIKFTGLDWLFCQRRISTMSDTELALAIEYHQAIYQMMMYEREKRRVEYFHRNAGKQIKISTSTGTVSSTETVVKKTKTIKPETKDKAQANVKALIEFLMKSGKTPEQIMKMMGTK